MKKSFFNFLSLLVLILPIYLTFFANKNQIKSSSILTEVKDQLSSTQLSFFGRIGSNGTGGLVNIANSGNPSNSSINISPGDTIAVANAFSGSTIYSLDYIIDNNKIMLWRDDNEDEENDGVSNNATGAYIIATRSAVHNISYKSDITIDNAKLTYLIKGTDSSIESPTDGMPDQGGFDLPSNPDEDNYFSDQDVICPGGGEVESIGSTIINEGLVYDGYYHTITCIGVSMPENETMEVTIGSEDGGKLINPSPSRSHVIGEVKNNTDLYFIGIIPFNMDTDEMLGLSFGKVALIENVRITATVDPTITFTIGTSGASTVGTTLCNSPIGIGATNTTPSSVNFGVLPLEVANNLAQKLSIITNSQNGYVLQAYENDVLKTTIGQTIPDTDCGGNNCSETEDKPWTNYTNSGFGYSIEVGSTTVGTLNNNISAISIGITTLGNYKTFGIGYEEAQPLISRTDTPSGTDSIYMCYRVVAGAKQEPGYYENSISYMVTATF